MNTAICCVCGTPTAITNSTLTGQLGDFSAYWCGCQRPEDAASDTGDGVDTLVALALKDFEAVPSYVERWKDALVRTDGQVEETDGYGQAEYEADDGSYRTAKWA